MSEGQRRHSKRLRLTAGPPSSAFIKWVRRVIVVGWAVLVLASAPSFVEEARRVWAMSSGPSRREALADLIVEAMMVDLALPFAALAMFGYGVVPNRNYLITGKPPVGLSWDEAQRKKDAKKRR